MVIFARALGAAFSDDSCLLMPLVRLVPARWEAVEQVAKTYSGSVAVEESSREQRRTDHALRALYAMKRKELDQETALAICSQCGEITLSPCRSCEHRGLSYCFPVCSACDGLLLTCRTCEFEQRHRPGVGDLQVSPGIFGEIGQDMLTPSISPHAPEEERLRVDLQEHETKEAARLLRAVQESDARKA